MNFDNKQQSLLTFRVGPVLCCAPSLPVRSIIAPPKLTRPPGSDQSHPGIFKHGSHIVKALDLRQKFGIEESQQTQPGRMIITIFEKENFSFWVDQILDVFDFPSEGWGNLPAEIPRGIFSRTLLLNKKIHLYSEFEKLATIKDLGYLKHYIQLLNEENERQTAHKNKTIKSGLAKKGAEPDTSDIPPIKVYSGEIKNSVNINSGNTNKIEAKSEAITITAKTDSNKNDTSKIDQAENKDNVKNTFVDSTATAFSKTSSDNPEIQVAKITNNKKETTTIVKDNKNIFSSDVSVKAKTIEKTSQNPVSYKTSPRKENIVAFNSDENNDDTFNNITADSNTSNFNKSSYSSVESNSIIEDEDSSSFWPIIFIFFILFLLGGILYYLLQPESKNIPDHIKSKPTINKPVESHVTDSALTEPDLIKAEIIEPVITADKINSSPDENVDLQKTEILEDKTSPHPEDNTETSAYHAEITKQGDEITITILQPNNKNSDSLNEEKIINPIKPLIIEQDSPGNIITEDVNIEKLKPGELTENIAKERLIKEVTHIVVKGDTLWAIAKKYVNDPFLYPELARLSNIKNPHRIYPGNKVRIRFVKY